MSFKDLIDKSPAMSKRRALETGDILDNTPHRMFGLPSLIEGMMPAKIVTQPAQSRNQPIVTPMGDDDGDKAAASDLMRRRRSSSILGGGYSDSAGDGGISLYKSSVG